MAQLRLWDPRNPHLRAAAATRLSPYRHVEGSSVGRAGSPTRSRPRSAPTHFKRRDAAPPLRIPSGAPKAGWPPNEKGRPTGSRCVTMPWAPVTQGRSRAAIEAVGAIPWPWVPTTSSPAMIVDRSARQSTRHVFPACCVRVSESVTALGFVRRERQFAVKCRRLASHLERLEGAANNMATELANGTKRVIDGVSRVYYDGYWVKAYDPPADTLPGEATAHRGADAAPVQPRRARNQRPGHSPRGNASGVRDRGGPSSASGSRARCWRAPSSIGSPTSLPSWSTCRRWA